MIKLVRTIANLTCVLLLIIFSTSVLWGAAPVSLSNYKIVPIQQYIDSVLDGVYQPYDASVAYSNDDLTALRAVISDHQARVQEVANLLNTAGELTAKLNKHYIIGNVALSVKIKTDILSGVLSSVTPHGIYSTTADDFARIFPNLVDITLDVASGREGKMFDGEDVVMRQFILGFSAIADTIENIHIFTVLAKSHNEFGREQGDIIIQLRDSKKQLNARLHELRRLERTILATRGHDEFSRKNIAKDIILEENARTTQELQDISNQKQKEFEDADLERFLEKMADAQKKSRNTVKKVEQNIHDIIKRAKNEARRGRVLSAIQLGLQFASVANDIHTDLTVSDTRLEDMINQVNTQMAPTGLKVESAAMRESYVDGEAQAIDFIVKLRPPE